MCPNESSSFALALIDCQEMVDGITRNIVVASSPLKPRPCILEASNALQRRIFFLKKKEIVGMKNPHEHLLYLSSSGRFMGRRR